MNYSSEELRSLGITFGENVSVHRSVEFFNPGAIRLGSNVRIDCFCVISAREDVILGNNVHLATGACISGSEGVEMGNFSGLSSRVNIFTSSDDYIEGHLTNPTVPREFTKIKRGKVVLGEHVIVGCGSIIMPGITLARGASIGALSFINRDVPECAIFAGNPGRLVGRRDQDRLATMEARYFESLAESNHRHTPPPDV
jgi:dTDP-4-amino-4,6-dideoxy-D-glucose acyltransferase